MARETINILIGGEAGQGLATVSQGLAKALVRGGWRIVMTQTYESRIRGGHNYMAIRASANEITAPQEEVDLLIALNQESIDLHAGELGPAGFVVTGGKAELGSAAGLTAPFDELAPGPFSNVAALGVAASLLGLDQALMHQVVLDMFGKKSPEVAEKNRQALDAANDWAAGQNADFEPLAAAPGPAGRMMMAGNEAIALGAISAGLKFCAFYPMTPATSIALNIIVRADEMGLVVEQAEDEIAAINMALGASYAGAPALVPTSGGGFALMTEGLSLAGMTETPLVLALAMRPGPATGLPTRTDQGDLEFALHGGHGEFPRAVFAPGSVEQCFMLTRRAMETAGHWQTPVLVLTDQFMADSYRSVEPFDLKGLPAIPAPDALFEAPEDYRRYAITESGVSPRLLPGFSKALVLSDSDEHDEQGHITEDLPLHVRMADKRMRKLEGMTKEALPPEFSGPAEPEQVLLCWGSSLGAVTEAAELLSQAGTPTGVCHFGQVWPLNPEGFLPRLKAAKKVIAVELNSTGQFARLLRRETGFEAQGRVLRYDGLPLTPQYILRQLSGE